MLIKELKNVAAISAAASVVIVVLAACEAPELNTRPWRWREAAAFDDAGGSIALTDLVEVADGAVLICGYLSERGGGSKGIIYAYNNGSVTRVFFAPYSDSRFNAIASNGMVLFVVGSKKENGTNTPYIVKPVAGSWVEVEVPRSLEGSSFIDAAIGHSTLCWLSTGERIYSYDNGVWQNHLSTNFPPYAFEFLDVDLRGRVYVCRTTYQFDPVIFMSGDGGESWAEEIPTIESDAYSWEKINGFRTIGGKLFLLADLVSNVKNHHIRYEAILTRDDVSPGEGRYEISFMAPRGPYFYGITGIAGRSTSELYAVGPLTSIAYENGNWYFEEVPEGSPAFTSVCAGLTTYWALSNSGDGNPPMLWRNP